jgi:hypothetical protein
VAVKEVLFRQISLYYSNRKLNVEYLFQVECEDKEGASFFVFLSRSICIKSASQEYWNKSERKGVQLVLIGMSTIY